MNDKTRDFIERNLDADIRQLALKGCRDKEVDFDTALRQIAGRQTARRKLPTWAAIDGIIYPPHLNMEQCSSEQTARYKASICRRLLQSPSTNLVDLTGGFGVDFAFMSEAFNEATYIERNSELFAISSENIHLMVPKARCVNSDGLEVLHATNHVSMIFMDPARRDEHGARTYDIGDCTPNILEIKDELLEKADFVMLKLSPMLDWRKAVRDLGESFVHEIHIISVQNECKELLMVLGKTGPSYRLFCVNDDHIWEVPSTDTSIQGHYREEDAAYLYEPNASIMKAGCFQEVAVTYQVQPLAPNSHLFISSRLIEDFPGRKFRIQTVTSMNKQELKVALKDIQKANITVRNFPISVAELRKKIKLSEGGNNYIFATTLAEGKKVLIICQHL